MEVIKTLLEKIANFFDLFDISYLVSGTAILGIVYFLPNHKTISYSLPEGLSSLWWFISCYSLGVVSTSLGRRLNQKLSVFRKKDHLSKYLHFEKTLINSKLDTNTSIITQLTLVNTTNKSSLFKYTEESLKNVYRLMWASLRERKDVPESLSLMRRYWLNSSTMDGLSVAAIVLFIVSLYNIFSFLIFPDNFIQILFVLFHHLSFYFSILAMIMYSTFSAEANRYRRYQVEELVGTYIYVKNKG